MKKALLLFALAVCFSPVFSQSAIAKLKYEEAEEAFAGNQFSTALVKLREAEELLGSVNPKLLYLRIMAQYSLLQQDATPDFALLQNARKNADFYLKKYENAGNVDKYREVYKISEALKNYPADAAAFAAYIESRQQAAAKERAKVQGVAAVLRFADKLTNQYRFKPGLSRAEFLSFNSAASRVSNVVKMGSGTGYTRKLKSVAAVFEEGPSSYSVDASGKVIDYACFAQSSKSDLQASVDVFRYLEQQLKDAMASGLVHITSTRGAPTIKVAVPASASNVSRIAYNITITLGKQEKWSYVHIYFS